MDVKGWLVSWFVRNADLTEAEAAAGASENYFDKGWLDSLKFINFVSDIEQEFKISFSNEEFQDRSFSTMDGLAKIIEVKLNAKR